MSRVLTKTHCRLNQIINMMLNRISIASHTAWIECLSRKRTVKTRPLPRSLYWLPVKHRVTYKMAALTFNTMSSSTPAYLNDLIQTAVPVRPLRSSDAPLLIVPKTRTEFARRSFSVVAPHTWNSLPSDNRSCRTVDTFKRHLKTHLFRQS